MIRFIFSIVLFFVPIITVNAQEQPKDAGSPVILSATEDTPIASTVINGSYYVVAQQVDGLYVTHGEDGSFRSYPSIDLIREVQGQYASFGAAIVNQNGPVRLDLLTGALFEPPATQGGQSSNLRASVAHGVDSSGGLAFQVAGANSAYYCNGFLTSLFIPEVLNGLTSLTSGASVNCDLGVVGSIVYNQNFTQFSFLISPDVTDTTATANTLGINVDFDRNWFTSSQKPFMKISQTAFDDEFSVLMQGHNQDDLAYLYNGSDGSIDQMQAGERFISLVNSGAIAINAAGECIFVDVDFNRVPLLSDGQPYSNCVGARQIGSKLVVAAEGSVITYYHELAEPSDESENPICIDTDGDGWGWDGSESCRIDPAEYVCIDADGDGWGWNGFGSCKPPKDTGQLPCIDTDGDGWGWTGSASCLIADLYK